MPKKVMEFKPDVPDISDFTAEEKASNYEARFFETYKLKNYVTSAPTYTPKNFYESVVYYDDGVNRRVYFYVNNTWRYSALT